jgi:hypothetical protein
MNKKRDQFRLVVLPRLLRQTVLVLLFLVLWAVITNYLHPFQEILSDTDNRTHFGFNELFSNILPLFFQFDVFIRVFMLIFAEAAALNTAGHYGAQIHSPLNQFATRQYIRLNNLWGIQLPILSIRNGTISKNKPHQTLQTVGGPGYVVIDKNSAAVFEQPNGDFLILRDSSGCYHGRHYIEPFTKLRQVFDLRPQSSTIASISSRTKDGIVVKVEDMELSYGLSKPIPKKMQGVDQILPTAAAKTITSAVHNLTYTQENGTLFWKEKFPEEITESINSIINRNSLLEILTKLENHQLFPTSKNTQNERSFISPVQSRRVAQNNTKVVMVDPLIPFSPPVDLQPPFNLHILVESEKIPAGNILSGFWSQNNSLENNKYFSNFTGSRQPYKNNLWLEWKKTGKWTLPLEIMHVLQTVTFKDTMKELCKITPERIALENEHRQVQAALQLVRNTPIQTFSRVKADNTDRLTSISLLIGDYLTQLLLAKEDLIHKGCVPPAALENAITHIQRVQDLQQPGISTNIK